MTDALTLTPEDIDLLARIAEASSRPADRAWISTLRMLADRLRALDTVVELLVPYARGDVLAALHREGEVLDETHEDDAIRVRACVDEATVNRFREYLVS